MLIWTKTKKIIWNQLEKVLSSLKEQFNKSIPLNTFENTFVWPFF